MKIGLTGGIGCGKSTVAGIFAEAGWKTHSSDAIVRDLLAGSDSLQMALQERWGKAVFSEAGEVKRRDIAKIVFNDSKELEWLESLLHPLVRAEWSGALKFEPDANWLVEMPLLFEKRLETEFDLTVCITSTPDVVEARMVRRGYTGAEVQLRRIRQMPLHEKAQRADRVVSNAGSLEFLKQQTLRLITELQA